MKNEIKSDQQIGSIGRTVEIDESKFGKRQYNKCWVLKDTGYLVVGFAVKWGKYSWCHCLITNGTVKTLEPL